ncbi:MAG: hypothetical protein JXQ90_07995 [Cyclobacteriaceae bacterium]
MNILRISVLTLACLISTISWSQISYSDDQFKSALESGSDFYNSLETKDGNLFVVFGMEIPHPSYPTETLYLDLSGTFANQGESYKMTFTLPTPKNGLYDELMDEEGVLMKQIQDRLRKSSNIQVNRGDNDSPTLSFENDHDAKNENALSKDLVKQINLIRDLSVVLGEEQQKLALDKMRQFEKDEFIELENDWFPDYVEDVGLAEFREDPDIIQAIGHWSVFDNDLEMRFKFYNFNDRFEVYLLKETGETPEDLEDVIDKLKYKTAHSFETVTHDNLIGAKATFLMDGSISGRDFIVGFNEYYFYAQKLNKSFK